MVQKLELREQLFFYQEGNIRKTPGLVHIHPFTNSHAIVVFGRVKAVSIARLSSLEVLVGI